MTRTTYALLVGINDYREAESGIKNLTGCVADVIAMAQLLEQRKASGDELKMRLLRDNEATRQGVIDTFRSHFSDVKPGDRALFYYAGHGSQQNTHPDFAFLEADGKDETLVCHDSRLPGGQDLADKTLAKLIQEVAVRGSHVTIVLDCCHSGDATRDPALVGVRQARPREDATPLDSYLLSLDEARALEASPGTRSADGKQNWTSLPQGRHVLLAACQADQTAKELAFNGQQRGAFSFYLQDALQRVGEMPTYRDLFNRVNTQVRTKLSKASPQSPQLEATNPADLDQPFLGGAIAPRPPYYTLQWDQRLGWIIDGGTVHGIPLVTDAETTYLAIVGETLTDRAHGQRQPIGQAKVLQILPGQSQVEITLADGGDLDHSKTYEAIITALPMPPMMVYMRAETDQERAALDRVRLALTDTGTGRPSLLVREGSLAQAGYILEAIEKNGAAYFSIHRLAETSELAVKTDSFDTNAALLMVQRLEHIARWQRLVELRNPNTRIPAGDVTLEMFRIGPDGALDEEEPLNTGQEIVLETTYDTQGKPVHPGYWIKLSNRGIGSVQRKYFVVLLDLAEDFLIAPNLFGRKGDWLLPNTSVRAAAAQTDGNLTETLIAWIPSELINKGGEEFSDTLKLIASTEEFDATLLAQEALPTEPQQQVKRGSPVLTSTLDRLLFRVGTRYAGAAPRANEPVADWMTLEVSMKAVQRRSDAGSGAPFPA